MARKKQETLVLFPEVLMITRKFSDAQFGALMRAVFSYRFGGEEYSGDDMAIDVAFQAIANQVDRLKEYSEINTKNASGSESKQEGAECSEMQGNHPPILSNPIQSNPIQSNPVQSDPVQSDPVQSESIREREAAAPPAPTGFSPPSVQDVEAYCAQKGCCVDAERFVDYYASIGWKVGKNPMKDWRAAVRTWVKKDSPKPEPKNCGYILAPAEDPWEVAVRRQREADHA